MFLKSPPRNSTSVANLYHYTRGRSFKNFFFFFVNQEERRKRRSSSFFSTILLRLKFAFYLASELSVYWDEKGEQSFRCVSALSSTISAEKKNKCKKVILYSCTKYQNFWIKNIFFHVFLKNNFYHFLIICYSYNNNIVY